jgi:hypothetical protein
MNHDILFDRIVPVSFSPGHMGTFLRGFLSQNTNNLFTDSFRKLENHEWIYIDIFDEFFSNPNNIFEELILVLQNYYQRQDIIKIAAVVISNSLYYLKNNHSFRPNTKLNDNLPFLLEFAKDPKYHQIQIPLELMDTKIYIKDHNLDDIKYLDLTFSMKDMQWQNKKINCAFFDEKSWIPYYFLKYKSVESKYLKATLNYFDNITSHFPYIQEVNNQLPSKTDNRYITINMYDLIFNKNLDQVYEIDPNFEFTKEKEVILNLANTSSIEILESFGLSHYTNINERTSVKEVLNMQKSNSKP